MGSCLEKISDPNKDKNFDLDSSQLLEFNHVNFIEEVNHIEPKEELRVNEKDSSETSDPKSDKKSNNSSDNNLDNKLEIDNIEYKEPEKKLTLKKKSTIREFFSKQINSSRSGIFLEKDITEDSSSSFSSLSPNNFSNNSSNNVLKKGLLIGINYIGTDDELRGCINDTYNLKEFLIRNQNFEEDDFIMMNDLINNENSLYPNKENILSQFKIIIEFCKENIDKKIFLFVSYSGYGYHIFEDDQDEDKNIDETLSENQKEDEVILPVNYDNEGYLVDEDIRTEFIDQLSDNVTLLMIMDCSHSGTVCNMKYNYKISKNFKESKVYNTDNTNCSVVIISGCQDNNSSVETDIPNEILNKNEFQGAMTASFIASYDHKITFEQLMIKMRKWLKKNGFAQIPQLSTGKPLSLEDKFFENFI